uniref:6-phosphogluconolactonase n=1 Tax=Odontella aurita TaxID=265563 RepID=A0A7S4J6Z8_9STRA|mmetsp:Transcript_40304/g.121396  ORF Transcript_40304/g.121396 Transcript_40304/m.121396 type:complete len:293 (+) Transcript_40304:174-1052(+)
MPEERYEASLVVAPTKGDVAELLHKPIVKACAASMAARKAFVVALSGGSLPSFLSSLSSSFDAAGIDPHYDRWHVLLADERCVPSDNDDSNVKSLRDAFLSGVPIPEAQVYGIDDGLLGGDGHATGEVAASYESNALRPALVHGDGKIDCAVLGFGPDGHTCSLFPDHALLKEDKLLVAPITDSPKPPPNRITLTLPVLNAMTRSVIFCGAGSSKGPILKAVFADGTVGAAGKEEDNDEYSVGMADPAPYPCGMVRPNVTDAVLSPALVFVVDGDAARELDLSDSPSPKSTL